MPVDATADRGVRRMTRWRGVRERNKRWTLSRRTDGTSSQKREKELEDARYAAHSGGVLCAVRAAEVCTEEVDRMLLSTKIYINSAPSQIQ